MPALLPPQLDLNCPLFRPVREQGVQALAPALAAKVLVAQLAQTLAPAAPLKVPASQEIQVVLTVAASVTLYLPASQFWQADEDASAAAALHVPFGQASHPSDWEVPPVFFP